MLHQLRVVGGVVEQHIQHEREFALDLVHLHFVLVQQHLLVFHLQFDNVRHFQPVQTLDQFLTECLDVLQFLLEHDLRFGVLECLLAVDL